MRSRPARQITHDLRNPLNTLQLSLGVAEEAGGDEHLDRARRAADRIDTLLEDLLALALQGEEIDDREPVPLDEAAETAWQTVETDDGRLTVETTATIDADPTRLGEVLENLIRNGVEHGSTGSRTGGPDPVEHGQPPVEITVGDCPDGFYVADDGPGIPADRRGEVFETGYSTAADGTGFGLSIVEEIVEAHDWEITVTESEAGGARFEITGVDTR